MIVYKIKVFVQIQQNRKENDDSNAFLTHENNFTLLRLCYNSSTLYSIHQANLSSCCYQYKVNQIYYITHAALDTRNRSKPKSNEYGTKFYIQYIRSKIQSYFNSVEYLGFRRSCYFFLFLYPMTICARPAKGLFSIFLNLTSESILDISTKE